MDKFKTTLPSAIAIRTAAIMNGFERMTVAHRAMADAHDTFDALRIAHRNGAKGPRRAAFMFSPSHNCKSHTVRSYIEFRVVPELIAQDPILAGKDISELISIQKCVLHVTLSAEATAKSLATDILIAAGDPDPYTGTRQTLWRRALTVLEQNGTELLVIDEVQHLASSKTFITAQQEIRTTFAHSMSVSDTIKVLLIRGAVPVVFVGISQARGHLLPSTQLTGRVVEEIDIPVLDWANSDHQTEFLEFAGRLALEMKKQGLVDHPPRLVYGETPSRLYVACGGRLGMLCRIVEKATILAARDDRRDVTEGDLAHAVDSVCVGRGFISENPFHGKMRKLELEG
jgi:hypothetical protein